MNNILPPIHRAMPVTTVKKRGDETQQVDTHSDERQQLPVKHKQDRRKNGDRRKNRNPKPGLYEFRSGKGRRRSDRLGQSIRIDV